MQFDKKALAQTKSRRNHAGSSGLGRSALAVYLVAAHYLFRFTKIPNVRTMTAQAAARRAPVRIASVAMPKPLCATISDRIAAVAAARTKKVGMNTRPMQT